MMRLTADRSMPIPYPITLLVVCDARGDLFPCWTRAEFPADAGHPRDPAIRAGWKITADGVVLCPACAKRARP